VKALRRFEDWVAGALEDRLGAALGGRLHPADLAARLAQAMDDHRLAAAGRTFVPNFYRFHLGPAAYAELAGYAQALEEQLAEFARGRAAELGYDFTGRPVVRLLVEPELSGTRFRLAAELVDAGDIQRTRALPAAQAPARLHRALVVVPAGRGPVPLAGEEVTLGRALDNAVIVEGPSVSRHHARLVRRGDHWLLEDLASAHGCFVNGERVTSSLLRPGDEIRLGAAVLRFDAVGGGPATP
jgi:hypothetical protein